jgi:nitrogen fixation protein NifQ
MKTFSSNIQANEPAMNGPDRLRCPTTRRAILLADLLTTPATALAASDPNRLLLASMIAGQAADTGCLPAHLGLGDKNYRRLVAEYFLGFDAPAPSRQVETLPEWGDLQKLLLDHRAHEYPSEIWMADIIATACTGHDHLWQDLGLANRNELSKLMWVNFPELARSNTSDMKWKKFLYRQFCSREGIYVCPAPSCSQCKDYTQCFGPEN